MASDHAIPGDVAELAGRFTVIAARRLARIVRVRTNRQAGPGWSQTHSAGSSPVPSPCRCMEVRRFACDPPDIPPDIVPFAQLVHRAVGGSQFPVFDDGMDGSVADRMHGHGHRTTFTLLNNVMAFHPLSEPPPA